MSATELKQKEAELVLQLKAGLIDWFQYFERFRALTGN